jgi:acyl-CoA synthetase (AMP-forming)/AMP-acid ligase II
VPAAILTRCAEVPEARCLGFYSADGLAWRSRQSVVEAAANRGAYLQSLGLRAGDVNLIVLSDEESASTTVLATLFIGAIPLLVAPPTVMGTNRVALVTLRNTIRHTRPRLMIYADSLAEELPAIEQGASSTRFVSAATLEAERQRQAFVPVSPAPADIVAMQPTSGTTGRAKICVWDHAAVLAAVSNMEAAMALTAHDICVNWTPLYHDMGLVNNFLLCLTRGVPLVMLSPRDFIRRPALWLRALSDAHATLTWSPNFGFAVTSSRASDEELQGVRLDQVRAFWNAAERIHIGTIEHFYQRFAALGVRRDALKTNYGCAENVGGATFSALDQLPMHDRISRRLLERHQIASPSDGPVADSVSVVGVGRPAPGISVHILSSRGTRLPDGHIGEICLDTPSRMRGYHHDTVATARALRGDLLHTGDLGYVRNAEVFWIGRRRERITVHGRKIDASGFEATLKSIPGLREGCFVAFGVPDSERGTEKVVVVSEVRNPLRESPDMLIRKIRRACFLDLGLSPHDVVLVQPGTLTKTSSGKRRHRHFRSIYLSGTLDQFRLCRQSLQS